VQPIADAPQQLFSERDVAQDECQQNKLGSRSSAGAIRNYGGAHCQQHESQRDFLKQSSATEPLRYPCMITRSSAQRMIRTEDG
jgi:hypothetical protein